MKTKHLSPPDAVKRSLWRTSRVGNTKGSNLTRKETGMEYTPIPIKTNTMESGLMIKGMDEEKCYLVMGISTWVSGLAIRRKAEAYMYHMRCGNMRVNGNQEKSTV